MTSIYDTLSSLEPAWYQAGSTVVLVAVTYYYAQLIKKQISSERRQAHSNTLRQSVSDWLEQFPPQSSSLSIELMSGEFQIIPENLTSDPYITDFRKNHALEIDDIVEKIEGLVVEFESEFKVCVSDIEITSKETFPFCLNLSDEVTLEEIVLYMILTNRSGDVHTINRRFFSPITHGNTSPNEFSVALMSSSDLVPNNPGTGDNTVMCEVNLGDYEGMMEVEEQVYSDFADGIEKLARSIDKEQKARVEKCIRLIEEIDSARQELRSLLEGYNREPIYPGHCRFINYITISLRIRKFIFKKQYEYFGFEREEEE